MSVSKRGFSLVELSIVLVILGLLTGGILAGQSLIRAAELRSVSTQYQQILSAVQSFRDKYMALPGDMRNATSFWGTAANCPGTSAQGSTTPATCNGDGDGMIEPTTTASNETFRLWQQLANAGLIEGQYSGVTGGGANEFTGIASNALRGKINNSYWFSLNWGAPLTGDANWFSGEYGNRLSLGALQTNAEPAAAIMRPDELWNLDVKLDDGKPGTGKLWAIWRSACTNSASNVDYAADYLLTSTSVICSPVFRSAF